MSCNYFEYEAWKHFVLNDFCQLVEDEGDHVFDLLEKYKPSVYESFCAHKANKDVEEFLDSQYQSNYNDDCDYWKDEGEYND